MNKWKSALGVVMVILIGLGQVYFKGENQINDYEMTVSPKVYELLSKASIERAENVNPYKGDVVNPNPRILNSNSMNIIIDKYQIQFEDLQAKATRQMDNLLHQAVKEYHSSKGKGKDIAYFELYKKYSLAARKKHRCLFSLHPSIFS
jgi:hypothetical protein